MIRKVVKSDLKDVIEIKKTVWDGYDYIPEVFEEWIKEEKGEFLAYEKAGKVIGLVKTTDILGEIAWLEGFRVHGDYRNQGIGSELAKVQMDHVIEMGYKRVMLSTYYTNESVSLVEKAGFDRVGSYKYMELKTEDSDLTYELAQVFKYPSKWISFGWLFYPNCDKTMNILLERGEIYENHRCKVVISDYLIHEGFISLAAYEGESQDVVALAKKIAFDRGYDNIGFMCDDLQRVKDFLDLGATIEDEEPWDVFVYEKHLD